MTGRVDEFVAAHVAALAGHEGDVHRVVGEPSGLTPAEMMEALAHPGLGRAGIQLIADFMAPKGSLYYDAIFGGYHGQRAIRGWLVPAMAEIEFIRFVPMAESVLFDDGQGGSSVDEWRMVADFGDGQEVPLSRGVSVRRYRGGWITWACDVYDTGPFRQPPPPGAEPPEGAAPLPPVPAVDWVVDAITPAVPLTPKDVQAMVDEFHPTESVYVDPLFGDFHGRDEIGAWLLDVMPRIGRVAFDPIGPELTDGATSVQEWVQVALPPDGRRVPVARGTSVRRRRDGWLVYAADYFDTASMSVPEAVAASVAAGATIGVDDIVRYRSRPSRA